MLSWALSSTLWHDTGPGLHRAVSAQPACPLRRALGSQGTHEQRHFLSPLILPYRSWNWICDASLYHASACRLLVCSTVTMATKSTYKAAQPFPPPLMGCQKGQEYSAHVRCVFLRILTNEALWGLKSLISFITCFYFLLEIIQLSRCGH